MGSSGSWQSRVSNRPSAGVSVAVDANLRRACHDLAEHVGSVGAGDRDGHAHRTYEPDLRDVRPYLAAVGGEMVHL